MAVTPASGGSFARYSDGVEQRKPGEEQVFEELAATMQRLNHITNDRYRHAVRAVHAKSHGLLRGELSVYGGLPAEYAQGLFAREATYGAILRFSTNPGDILADSVSTPRGVAIKVVGVAGEMLPGHAGQVTQDLVLVNAKAFGVSDASAFLKQLKLLEKHVDDSEPLKKVVSFGARTVNAALHTVGADLAALRELGHPETNPLGETYGSLAALRYGDYVAKIIVRPWSENLRALTNKHLHVRGEFSAIRDELVRFFKTETAVWEVAVQLCTDLEKMPVEDPSVEWDETASPYRGVARLTVKPQDAYSPQRRVYVDELLSFNPFHALAAHRPLGNIMRARFKVYATSKAFRHKMNGRVAVEPREIGELPD